MSVFLFVVNVFVFYVDDGIFMSSDKNFIDKAIKNLMVVGLKIEEQGYPLDYVGVNIKKNEDRSIKLSQPALIQSIIKDVQLGPRASLKPVLAPSTKIFQHTLGSKDFDNRFHYRSAIGKPNYLAGLT